MTVTRRPVKFQRRRLERISYDRSYQVFWVWIGSIVLSYSVYAINQDAYVTIKPLLIALMFCTAIFAAVTMHLGASYAVNWLDTLGQCAIRTLLALMPAAWAFWFIGAGLHSLIA